MQTTQQIAQRIYEQTDPRGSDRFIRDCLKPSDPPRARWAIPWQALPDSDRHTYLAAAQSAAAGEIYS